MITIAYQPTGLVDLSCVTSQANCHLKQISKKESCIKSTRPVAVITGAARGIGKGCALELARGGFNLLINDLPDADSVEKPHITQQDV